MGIRALTGYIAHAALVAYWVWVVASTAPQLRKGTRDRRVRVRVLIIKTTALLLTAVVVGIIHYWATAWWQVIVAVPVAAGLGVLLHREYRRTVAAPRHRLPLARRARMLDLRPRPRSGAAPLHLRGDDLGPAVTPIAD
jgi:TRAP-type C4-dicarboxylate transport system permease large subunit